MVYIRHTNNYSFIQCIRSLPQTALPRRPAFQVAVSCGTISAQGIDTRITGRGAPGGQYTSRHGEHMCQAAGLPAVRDTKQGPPRGTGVPLEPGWA